MNPGTLQMGLVTVVAGKEFIASVSCQSYRHVLPSHAADMKRWHHRGVAKRFFQRRRQLVESLFDIWLNKNFMVVRAKLPCHGAGMHCFVEVLMAEANRECLDLARARSRHHRDHD